ncbi:hypothetical protein D3C86_2035080 [compost metagenome]
MTATTTHAPPTINGICGLNHSASLPARNGAMAPPMKRKKLYAADAVGRSTGAAFMTAVVIKVLLFPRNAPAMITATIMTVLSVVQFAMTNKVTANRSN